MPSQGQGPIDPNSETPFAIAFVNGLTAEQVISCLTVLSGLAGMPSMEPDPLTILTATGVAGYVALIADWVASNHFGLSNVQIRGSALVAAALVGLWLAADLVGRGLRKSK